MRLNHLNLCVDDLQSTCSFFETHFDFQILRQVGENLAVLSDKQGFTLVLSSLRRKNGEPFTYPQDFHIGFLVETSEQVDQTYKRLKTANIEMPQEPHKVHGSYGFYFRAFNNILFEVSCSA